MLEDPELFAAVEAMLFVSGEPVAIPDMARALEIAPFQLEEALDRMGGKDDWHHRLWWDKNPNH